MGFSGTALAQSWDELAGSATGGGVSNNAGSSSNPSIALDSNGNPHFAWADTSGTDYEIYYAYWNGSGWATRGGGNSGGGVSFNTSDSQMPSLALDSNGYPHIAWMDKSVNYEIYYAYWDGSGWVTHGGADTGGGVSNNASTSYYPSLALDNSGNPHIAWVDYYSSGGDGKIYYAYWDGANWVTHDGANSGGGVSNNAVHSLNPSLALDSNGNPHIAWMDWSVGNWEIYYAYWDGTQWTTHRGTNTGGGVSNNTGVSQYPSLALDSFGNPHIAWMDTSGGNNWEIYYAYWYGSGWATYGGANGGGGVSNNTGYSFNPSLALDSSGNPHIAWANNPGSNWEIYYAYWDGSGWVAHDGANTGGGVSNNAGSSQGPSLALDSCGNPHLAWGDSSGGDGEIYYRYWNTGECIHAENCTNGIDDDGDGLVDCYDPDCNGDPSCDCDITPPVADFSCDPNSGDAPLTVNFTNNSSGDDLCIWDFGDGTTIAVGCEDQEHTFTQEGSYDVTLTVAGIGGIDTAECTIEVTGQPAQLEKPTGVKHVVFIDIDGLIPDKFQEELDAGNLPTFAEILGGTDYVNPRNNAHSIIVQEAKTGFPSLTLPGHASIFTGCYINKHGIYGNSWFDRTKGTKGTAYHYLGLLTALSKYNLANSHLKAPTIYDAAAAKKYDSIVGFNYYYDYGGRSSLIRWIEPNTLEKGYFATGETNDFDDTMVFRVLEELKKKMFSGGKWNAAAFPEILTLYFAAVDHEGHSKGVISQGDNLIEIDAQLSILIHGGIKAYPLPREEGNGKAGQQRETSIVFQGMSNIDAAGGGERKLIDDVVFVICADHGHSNVNENRLICFDDIKEAIEKIDSGYDVERILPGKGKKSGQRGRLLSKNPKILLELNDGMAHVYVQNKQNKKWNVPADLCNDIVPFARILARTQDTLGDYILKREGVSMILVKDKDAGKYKVFNGGNGCTSPLGELTEYFTGDEAFRINMLYNGIYSGDIVILANYDDSAQSEGYYLEDPYWSKVVTVCPSPMKSTHGNINLSNLKIPFIIAGKNVKSYSVPSAEQVDIAPTAADILGFEMPDADGTSIFQK